MPTDDIEVGYRLMKKYWNKGYATEMSKNLLDHGFNKCGLNKIVGITHPPYYEPSRATLAHQGCQRLIVMQGTEGSVDATAGRRCAYRLYTTGE